jgi:hypothetical protein
MPKKKPVKKSIFINQLSKPKKKLTKAERQKLVEQIAKIDFSKTEEKLLEIGTALKGFSTVYSDMFGNIQSNLLKSDITNFLEANNHIGLIAKMNAETISKSFTLPNQHILNSITPLLGNLLMTAGVANALNIHNQNHKAQFSQLGISLKSLGIYQTDTLNNLTKFNNPVGLENIKSIVGTHSNVSNFFKSSFIDLSFISSNIAKELSSVGKISNLDFISSSWTQKLASLNINLETDSFKFNVGIQTNEITETKQYILESNDKELENGLVVCDIVEVNGKQYRQMLVPIENETKFLNPQSTIALDYEDGNNIIIETEILKNGLPEVDQSNKESWIFDYDTYNSTILVGPFKFTISYFGYVHKSLQIINSSVENRNKKWDFDDLACCIDGELHNNHNTYKRFYNYFNYVNKQIKSKYPKIADLFVLKAKQISINKKYIE